MRIAILGAGGLGSQLGAALHDASKSVDLIARGPHLRALQARGLTVIEGDSRRTLPIPSLDADQARGPYDIVFVTVKTYSLADVASIASLLAGDDGLVVPLVNGVDARAQLSEAGVRDNRICPGVAYLTAFRTQPGTVVRHGSHQRMVFGREGHPGARHRLAAAFEATQVVVEFVDDIRVELWRKMAVVCTLTSLCGTHLAPIGAARAEPSWPRQQRAAVSEVFAVARAAGVALGDDHETAVHATLDGFDDGFFPSLLHDLQRGQRTEVEALNGTISELGRRHGVSTPHHDAARDAIRAAQANLHA